jgi:hypothetical protein
MAAQLLHVTWDDVTKPEPQTIERLRDAMRRAA